MNVAKRRQISTIQALSLAAVVAILIGVYQIRWQPHDSNGVVDAVSSLNGQWVDRSAPYFELVDLEGRVHRLSEYRGKVIFLNFWASFCEPCRREMPSMEALVRQYEPQGMVMLAVSVDPESDEQYALERGAWLAKHTQANLELLICYYNEYLTEGRLGSYPSLENVQEDILKGLNLRLESLAKQMADPRDLPADFSNRAWYRQPATLSYLGLGFP